MAASKDRVLLKQDGVLVTYERFVEPEGREYRIEDIQSVEMQVVEEESERPPIRWFRTVGGSAVIGAALALVGGFQGPWLTAGIIVVLVGVAIVWWGNRIRSNKFKVYHVVVTLLPRRENQQEHRIISTTSRVFGERLQVVLKRAMIERLARYENP